MALHGLPVAIHSGGGGPDRSQPVQNEIGEKLFWTRLNFTFDSGIDRCRRVQLAGRDQAAQFCLQNDTHLEQGLKWSEIAISRPFVGQVNFTTLSTKAQLLAKLGRGPEAKKTMDTAMELPGTTSLEIHVYGRTLLGMKKVDEALAVFEVNAKRFGDQWPTHVGLARGYAAKGDTAKALEHAKLALAQAPDPLNKKSLADMVKDLEAGQTIR